MISRGRRVAGAVAFAGVVALVGAASADPPPPQPDGTIVITPTSGGSQRDLIYPVAGSPSTLVYAQARPDGVAYLPPPLPYELVARSASGTVTDLGGAPSASSVPAPYSLAGNELSAAVANDTPDTVYWWDVTGGAKGTTALTGAQTWLASAPDGFVYESGGTLYDEDVADHSATSLGTPFGGAAPSSAVSDGNGLLVTSGTEASYLSWSDRGHYTSLDTAGQQLGCFSVDADYSACYTLQTTSGYSQYEILPLDGRPTAALPSADDQSTRYENAPVIVGSTIISETTDGHLHSRSYTSPTVQDSTTYELDDEPLVAAFNAAVAIKDSPSSTLLSFTSAAADPTTIVTAPYTYPIASALSLSPGQLVYNDDRSNSAVPPASTSTLRTQVATSAASLAVGPTTTVAAGDAGSSPKQEYSPTTPLASGTTTAYPSASTFEHSYDTDNYVFVESLTVAGPHRSRVIKNIIVTEPNYPSQWRPVLSGNRLTYLAQTGTGTPAFFVYDVAKDTTTKLFDYDPTKESQIPTPAVSGNYVAMLRPDGAVVREDLNTGTTTTLAAARDDFDGNVQGTVFAHGDYVAWSYTTGGPQRAGDADEPLTTVDAYRDARTMAPAVPLGHPVVGLAATGPILLGPDANEDTYTLRTFAGPSVQLVDEDQSTASDVAPTLVFVEGRTVAWLDTVRQTVNVAPVDVTPAAPFFEGGTLAPEPAHPGQVAWHPYAPYSEPLTSCSAAVMRSGSTVATLSCNKAEMAVGVADVEWNGQIDGAKAPAGTYHYEITAAGDGGAARDSAGSAAPVAGHFTIG